MTSNEKNDLFLDLVESLNQAIVHASGGDTPVRIHDLPHLDVAAIRAATGLSQPAFAQRFGFSVSTLRAWEQGRRRPRGPARTLLYVLAHSPSAVDESIRAVEIANAAG